MLLSAEDLLLGQVNSQSQVWVKPGRTHVVPVSMPEVDATLVWQFSSQPKVRTNYNYGKTKSRRIPVCYSRPGIRQIWHLKWVRLALNWTNLELFKISFQLAKLFGDKLEDISLKFHAAASCWG